METTASDKFHRTLEIPATDNCGPLTVTYAIAGPEHGEDVPTILFCGGMLATRWIAMSFDWMAEKKGVRMLFIDRPGIGGSTDVPIGKRISTFLQVVPALLAHLKIKQVTVASHSAGTLYALNLISHIPEILNPANLSVTLLSPWVHQSHTGIPFLIAASKLPDGIVDQWDKVLHFSIGSAAPVFSSSGSVFSSIGSFFSSGPNTADEDEQRCLEGYGVSSKRRDANFKLFVKRTFDENVKGVNDEAKLCLKSTADTHWLACEDYEEYIRELGKAYTKRIAEGGKPLKVDIVLPESDILVGKKGMAYFEDCWKSGSPTSLEVTCVRIKGADHEGTIHPATEGIQKMFRMAKGNFE